MNHKKELTTKIQGSVLFNEPMRNHTTFHIGGPAEILVIPKDLDDIKYSITFSKEKKIPIYITGNGSKILCSDNGIRGMVIKIAKNLSNLEVSGERIIADAGCSLSKLIKIATHHDLSGLEFAAGIPGTLGGAIVMNASTYIGSVRDIIDNVTVLDLLNNSLHILSNNECCFRYRKSIFQENKFIILKAEMKMRKSNQIKIEEKIYNLLEKRSKNQPINKHSAGCTFKNLSKTSAGKIIDMAGLKGLKKGDAKISEVHANFIVNLGDAKANDVIFLIRKIQKKVKERFNVELDPELILMGDFARARVNP